MGYIKGRYFKTKSAKIDGESESKVGTLSQKPYLFKEKIASWFHHELRFSSGSNPQYHQCPTVGGFCAPFHSR